MWKILVTLVCIASTGCATMVRGSSEMVDIETTPTKAKVTLSTGHTCYSPCSIDVRRKGDITVTVEMDGYETFETVLTSSIGGGSLAVGTIANLIFLPIINDIVDYNTGANYAHKPNPLVIRLAEIGSDEIAVVVLPETEDANSD